MTTTDDFADLTHEEAISAAARLKPDPACVEWPHGVSTHGYGMTRVDGKVTTAHRAVLLLANPPTDPSLHALHGECHNKLCIRPDHLSWGSRSENMMDKVRDGTSNRGERCAKAKLTEDDVWDILGSLDAGVQAKALSERYRVSQVTISDIKHGRRWAWMTKR